MAAGEPAGMRQKEETKVKVPTKKLVSAIVFMYKSLDDDLKKSAGELET